MKKCLNCGEELSGKQKKYCSHKCACKYYKKTHEDQIEKYGKGYREQNSKKNIKYQQEYREKNRESLLEDKKEYYIKNKAVKIEYNKLYKRKRRKADPAYRMGNNFSRNVNHSLKFRGSSKKNRHWEDIVGYTVVDLKKHLESQFRDGMTWDNYGEWHVDHVIPIVFFKYTSMEDVEFRYCWSLHNLQPLWAKDNLKKNDKVLYKNR